mgnify:FL=1
MLTEDSAKHIKKSQSQRKDVKALFHCWSHKSEVVGESTLCGGHSGGQISATFGLVEYEDGTMHEVEPHNIRFVDGRINEYGFREGLDESENQV